MPKLEALIKNILFIALLLGQYICQAQVNLVPNPGFEDTVACPNSAGQLNFAKFWVNPTKSSPDYFNGCSDINYGVPFNFNGNQNANNGKAYGFFVAFAVAPGLSNSYREYVQVQLDSLLVNGETYCIEYYLSLADSMEYAVNNVGAYFSQLAISSANFDPLSYIPQVVNTSSNLLTNIYAWTKVSGQFVAQGGEKYLTIGNFNNNASSDTVFVRKRNLIFYTAGYYIDDVSVVHIDAGAGSSKGYCNGVGVTLGRPAKPGIAYSWSPAVGLSDTTIAQPIATPTVTTTYYLTATLTSSGCSKTDSVTVFYVPIGPSALISVGDSALCLGETGTATVTVNNAVSPYTYNWSGGTSSTGMQVSGLVAGNYVVTITDALGCTATSGVAFSNISAPSASISTAQTTITEGEQITLNGSGGISYLWTPAATLSCSNCQNPIALPTSTTIYTLTVTAANGCTDTSDITIKVNPLCLDEKTIFIPNVFSPNNDGKNDVLAIEGNGLTNIYWGIYDRWGNLVFEAYDQTHPWDGTLKGSPVEAGVYSYYLRGTCVKTNGVVTLKGNVSLIR